MVYENQRYYLESIPENRRELHADCENCFGLCCVALYFSASEGFPTEKEAGQPCVNLQTDFRCGVHNCLRERGLKGCLAFDCFGAGQKVSQVSFGGIDWRKAPELSKRMFEVRAEFCSGQRTYLGHQKRLGKRLDFIGRDLRKINLRGEDLRGAYLIAADLRGLDLSGTDLIGADFRDADIRGANLTKSLFLTQAQINSAKGDIDTKLSSYLTRPTHWRSN